MSGPNTAVARYEPNWASLRGYAVPEWYKDAFTFKIVLKGSN